MNEITQSLKNLKKDEEALYQIEDDSIAIDKTCKIEYDLIHEDMISDEEHESDTIVILKIKKPDFLGDSKWIFKHGHYTIDAKITDSNWLNKFHTGIVPLVPNDAMKVRMKETIRYDKKGNIISKFNEIYDIIRLIHNDDIEQIGAFDEG